MSKPMGEPKRRITKLHGRIHPLRFDIEEFENAFMGVCTLLAEKYSQLPSLEFTVFGYRRFLLGVELHVNFNSDHYKLIAQHTMGSYWCHRGDGKRYKMTELNPKKIVTKIECYFVLR